jgi:hypothetical protein
MVSFSWNVIFYGIANRAIATEFAQHSVPVPTAFAVAAQANQVKHHSTKRALHEPDFGFAVEHAPFLARGGRNQQCDLGRTQGLIQFRKNTTLVASGRPAKTRKNRRESAAVCH